MIGRGGVSVGVSRFTPGRNSGTIEQASSDEIITVGTPLPRIFLAAAFPDGAGDRGSDRDGTAAGRETRLVGFPGDQRDSGHPPRLDQNDRDWEEERSIEVAGLSLHRRDVCVPLFRREAEQRWGRPFPSQAGRLCSFFVRFVRRSKTRHRSPRADLLDPAVSKKPSLRRPRRA